MEQTTPKSSLVKGAAIRGLVVLGVLVVVLLALSLSGCKYSDVLTEHIEDPINGILDENQDPILRQNPDAPEETDLVSMLVSDSDRIDEQLQDLPRYDSQVPPQDETDNREHEDETPDDANATEGDEQSDKDGQNQNAGDSESRTDAEAGTDKNGEGEGTTDQTQDQEGESAIDGIAAGGSGGTGTAYDATGEYTELPEAGSIAAVGQYATIVQMLAGRGGLKATDAEWLSMVRAKGIFPNEEAEGIDDIAVAWQGSGEAGYTLDIEALIAADPDVLIVDNSSVILSDDERARLQEAQIDLVTAPVLGRADTPDADIVSAVAIVGQMLSAATTYYDTSAQVTNYDTMHDEAINNCLNANGGYSYKTIGSGSYEGIYQGTSLTGMDTTNFSSTRFSTAFIDSVTTVLNHAPTAKRTYSDGTLGTLDGQVVYAGSGIGLSVAGMSDDFILIDYYMQVAGVVDNSYDGVKPIVSGDGIAKSTIILPGYAEDLIPSEYADSFIERQTYSALWYKMNETQWATVGDQAFPGVLARTSPIAQAIVAGSGSNGIYNVGQPYFVRVVPTGVAGSWATGTVESYLMAPWTFGAFQQNDIATACDSYADAFYSVFYRVDDASAVIEDYDTSYTAGG